MTTVDTQRDTQAAADGGAAGGATAPGPAAEAHAAQATAAARRRRFTWWLLAITAGGLAVRLIYLLVWRNPSEIVGDPYYYHHGANLLADGEGFIHPYRFLLYGDRMPGADHPPGLITILGAFSWVGLRSFFAHQVIGCVLGALGVGAMGLAGRRIAGERVGLLVAGLTALSPNVFFFDPVVVSETLVVSTTALVLLTAYRWWDRPSVRAAGLFGLAVGLAALVRSEALLLGPAIALPLLWWRRRQTRWLPQLAAAAGVAAVAIAPWAGYNMARFERPTTLSAQFDQTLGTANCDDVYYGDRVGYWQLQCIQRVEHLVGEGDASAQGRGFQRIAREYVRDHADRVPYVVAARVGRTFGVFEPQNQIGLDKSVESKEEQLGKGGLFTWFAVAVAGALGLVGLRRAGRPIFPLVATVLTVAVTVAIVYGNTRFRLPAELALMVPAAVTLDAGLQAARRRWRAHRPDPSGPGDPAGVNGNAAVHGGAAPDDGQDGPATPHPGEAEDAPAPENGDAVPAGGQADPPHGEGEDAPAPGNGETAAALATSPPGTAGPAGGARLPEAAGDPPGGLGSSAGHFAGFDGLRAIAAFGVLLTHVGLQSGFVGRNGTGPWISRADAGVALFFVLSGFLLYRPFVAARLDGRSGPRVRSYLRKRFLRIFPAYWLALTVLVVVVDTRGREDISGWGDLVIYYGLLQSYSKAHALGGLQQAWTLVNEVAFYLLLPLWAAGAAWLAGRLKPRTAVLTELGILLAAALGALGFRWWLHSFQANDPSIGNFDPRFHWLLANFHLFVPGMALAVGLEWSRRRHRPLAVLEAARRHPLVCWAAAGLAFWALSTQLDLGVQVGATGQGQAIAKEVLYAAVGFALVVPVALAGATLPRSLRWLGAPLMVALGVLSYGIYLWHEGATDLYRDIRNLAPLHGWFAGILVVTTVASVALAAVSYLVVERPALGLKDRHRKLFAAWRPVHLPADAGLHGALGGPGGPGAAPTPEPSAPVNPEVTPA
jgi:peptidoglycan/LPS O-acetylase OafA/YrhL/4-amino-4-deoxy-L-arabinose transferase-like glycosyltransferase